MTGNVVFDLRPALETTDDLANNAPPFAIDQKPSRLVLIPDYLSATYLKDYLTKKGYASVLDDLEITTFEDLAATIVGSTASILDPELLKIILAKCVLSMTDPIAKKIAQTLKPLEDPEDSPFIDALRNEFVEYTSLISPCFQDRNVTENKILTISQNLPNILRIRAEEVIEFYGSLEKQAVDALNKLGRGPDVFLSRAHLVSEACKRLENNQLESFIKSNKITSIYVIGVPIFDETVTDLLSLLCIKTDQVIINITPEIKDRLENRLKARVGSKINFVQPIQPVSRVSIKTMEYSVPDRRREVELAALKVIELLEDGTPANEIMVISRMVSDYAPFVESVFRDYGLSVFIQTRMGIVFSPAYKLIDSLLELLVSWEKNREVSATQIATPLRVGFPTYAVWQGQRKKSKWPINDKQFLGIETALETIQAFSNNDQLKGWFKKIRKRHTTVSQGMGDYIYEPVIQLLEWVQNTAKSLVKVEPLITILRRFIEAYGIQQEFPVLSLLPNGRFALAREHISSQAERILRGLYQLIDQQKYVAQAKKTILGSKTQSTPETTWSDLRKAFLGNIGQMTYGLTLRDNDAIRLVDAGISHFVDTSHRIILGMTTNQFPRKLPEPFLFFSEFRAMLNSSKNGYFISSKSTHYEIEKYYYVTAKGRNNDLTISMNYLDERGHSQHWSVLHSPEKPKRIAPHELRVELSTEFFKAANDESHNLSNLLFQRIDSTQDRSVSGLTSEIENIFASLGSSDHLTQEKVSIQVSLGALLDRVINGTFNPEIERGPSQISNIVFNNLREPSFWELDMITYCPAMYYFYVFLYLMPNRDWIKSKYNEDALTFAPGYKSDFLLGKIPLPIWRTQFSTEGSRWIEKHLEGTTSINKIQVTAIENDIDNLDVHSAEKSAIKALLSYMSILGSYKFKKREKSSSLNIYRPISAWYKAGDDEKGRLRVFHRFTPKQPHKFTHVNTGGACATSPLVPDYVYSSFDKTFSRNEARQGVINLQDYMKLVNSRDGEDLSLESDVCENCVYMTLCGRWGF